MAVNLYSLLLSAKEMHRKAQKRMVCSYTIMIISLSCIFETEMHMFRTGHGCSTDFVWYHLHWQVRGFQAVLVLRQLKLGQHGVAWLGMMLAHFGHVYTVTAYRAELCWYSAGMVSSGSVNTVLDVHVHVDASICSILPPKRYLYCRAAISFWIIPLYGLCYCKPIMK